MTFLDPPLLLSLELHIPPTGESRRWTTPRDLSHLTPAQRVLVAQHLEAHLDALLADLGVRKRIEVGPTQTPEQAKQILQ